MAFTDTTNLGVNLVQAAYDKYVEFSLRTAVTFRNIVDKRPVDQSMPGSSVIFNIYPDMVPVTTPLTETIDPDAVAIPATTPVTVTLLEYGNSVQVTRKLRLFSLSDVDPAIADLVAYNMVAKPLRRKGFRASARFSRPCDHADCRRWNQCHP